nr:hypothetical protein [Tanacetum cinerariifolium]
MECKDYHSLPRKSIRKVIMLKRVTRKIGMEGNFVIPCNVGGTKDMSALVDQGSDVNVVPLSVYNKLTNEKLVETDVRVALASNSHINPLGIAEDVLVEVTGFVYSMDFMILDIKEDVKKPLILGTPFLTTARAEIKFDKGTISLRSKKSMVQFHISPDPFTTLEERCESKINTLSVVNERVLEWEEKIKFHHMKELEFKAWKNIKEDVKKPLILGTPFLTTARAEIKFDKGTISLRSGKSTVQFHISPDHYPTLKERYENKINTLSVVNERVLEWEEKIKFHHMKELEFEAWKSKYSKSKAFAPKEESSSGTNENHRGVT